MAATAGENIAKELNGFKNIFLVINWTISVQIFFYCLFIFVLSLEIRLSEGG